MRGEQRSSRRSLSQTQPWTLDPEAAQAVLPARLNSTAANCVNSPVVRMKVLFVGTPASDDVAAPPVSPRRRQRFELLGVKHTEGPTEPRIDRAFERTAGDVARSALAYAPTMPALTPVSVADTLRIERPRRRLRLSHEDGASERVAPMGYDPSYDPSPALIARAHGGALSRAWGAWQQQPPHVALGAAVAVCALSAIAAGLLLP
jgi:hypothetical protein